MTPNRQVFAPKTEATVCFCSVEGLEEGAVAFVLKQMPPQKFRKSPKLRKVLSYKRIPVFEMRNVTICFSEVWKRRKKV